MKPRHATLVRFGFALVAAVALLLPQAGNAVTATFTVYVEAQNGQPTCSAPGAPFAVNHVLVTTVDTTGPTAAVTKVDRQVCAGANIDPTLIPVDPGDWPAPSDPDIAGANAIETYLPLAALGGAAPVRLAVAATGATGGDDLLSALTVTPRGVATIPTLSEWALAGLSLVLAAAALIALRRRAGAALVVLLFLAAAGALSAAVLCDADGVLSPGEWLNPGDAIATDAAGDGGSGPDLRRLWAKFDRDADPVNLCLRIDAVLVFNTAPTATADGYATNEDAQLNVPAPGVLGNDTDPDPGQTLTAVLVTPPSNAAGFTLNADGSFSYTKNPNFNGTDSFTYHANDGFADSNDVTVTITVGSINDAPSFVAGPSQSVLQGAGAQTVNPWATAISPGPADESGQAVTFNVTANSNPGLFSVAPAVSPSGVLTYTPAAGQVGTANITITLQDDGGTANGGVDTSPPQTFAINVVDVNEAPSFTAGPNQTVNEDAGAQTVNPWATAISPGPPSESGQTLTFNVTGNTNAALFSAGPAVSPAGVLTYTPAANANGTATITIVLMDNGGTANGGVDTSAPQSFTITVNAVNDAPSFTKGPDQTVNEDAGAQTVNPWATAISPGPADESGQTVTFNVTGNTNPGLFSVAPAVSATGVLTYTPATNTTGTATITLTLQDDGGTANGGVDTSAAQTFTITVADVNDPPSFTAGPNQTVSEDAGAQTVNPWATAISPGPPAESGQTVTFNVTGNTNAALFSAGPAISPTGVLTYTPAANANGTATITIVLMDNGGTANGGVDTSAPQSFMITVNAVNDAPSFTKGPDQTINEDAGAQTVNPWATAISPGPADESGQTLTFNVTGNTNPSLFSVAPAVSAAGVLTYTPAANAAGSATITLALMDDGGTANGGVDTSAAQTFTITINQINDAPSFTAGPNQTVNEDAGAQTVNPWATAISPGPPAESGQTVTFNITGNTNPGLFSAGPAVSPTGVLTYTPAANVSGVATITLVLMDNGGTANGGVDTSAPQSFTITVNAVNDAPSFTAGPNQTVNEDAGAQTVNPWATAISPGPADESGQTVTFNITGNTNPGLFSAGPAVSPTGVLTYTPAANASGSATITLNLMDNGGTANGGVDTSAAQSFTITVNQVNDAPSFTAGPNQTVNEDAGAQTVNPWATAISPGPPSEAGQTLTFNITGNTNPGLFSAGPSVSATGVLTYTPAANAFGTATITLNLMDNGGTANGGVDTSAPQSFTITVNAVNDAPSFSAGPNQTVFEDSGAQTVNPWATAISAGPPNESGQTVTFQITGNTNPGLFAAGPAVSATGVLTYTPTANTAGVATITLRVMDDGGTANGGVDTSATQSFTITVTGINDAPSFVKGPDQTVNEDSGPQTVNPWATAISPGPPDEAGQTITFQITGNTNAGLFSAGPAVSAAGVLTYTSAPNAFGTATITLRVMDNGGTANGGVDVSPTQSFVITVNPVNDPPVALNDAFDFLGNTELRVDLAAVATPHALETTGSGFGVLDNDSDPVEGDAIAINSITVGACTDSSAPFDCTDAAVGTVHMQSNGRFSFEPAPGDTGATETFTYTIIDNGTPTPATSAPATVTLTRFARVWYVNPGAAAGTGTSLSPLNALTTLNGAGGAGDVDLVNDYIFVYLGNSGTTPLAGGIELETGQHLIGEHAGLSIPVNLNGNGSPTNLVTAVPGSRPLIDNTAAGGSAVSATDAIPIEIVGLSLAGNTNGIDLTTNAAFAGAGSTSILDNVIRAAGAEGIDVNVNGTGANVYNLSIRNNLVTAGGNGIDVTRTSGAATITAFNDNVVTGATGGTGISISGMTFDATPGGTFQAVSGGTTAIGISGDGVGQNGFVCSLCFGDLTFTGLTIYASNGAALNAFSNTPYTGSAGLRIASAAAGDVYSAVGGPAVDLSTLTMNSITPTTITSTNSPTRGAAFNSVLGTFTAGAGSSISGVTSAGGTSFEVGSSNASITYNGTINATVGKGVNLTLNTGSTIAFTGGLTLSTGSANAFNATGGGTVNVTGTNTLATTTGTALNVANTTIGASGMTFRSISANGAANGIVLNATGATAGLTVTGTGGAGTGGTIQNTTGHAVLLNSTLSPSFTNLTIQNSAGSGVKGSSVTNFTFANGSIDNSGTGGGADESNIAFNGAAAGTENNLSGTVSITGNSLTNGAWHGIDIQNFNGTIANATLSNNTLTSSTAVASSKGSAIRLQALGSATTASIVTRATIANNVIANFPSGAGIIAQGGNSNAAGPSGTFGTPGSGTNVIAITGNRIAGQNAANKMGTSAILATITGKGQGNFDVSNNGTVANPLTNMAGTAIGCAVNGPGVATITTNGNVIVANNTVASNGIGGGTGVVFGTADNPDLTWTINNNSISATDGNGILAVARGASGNLKVKIQNNSVAAPLTGVRPGIRIDAGNASSVDDAVCLNISGNTSAGSGGSQGIGLRKQGTTTTTNDFAVNGMAATASPGVEAFVDGLNPAGGATLLISATSGFSNCSLP